MHGVIGHQNIIKKLEQFADLGTLSGSWIFSGIKGIGKFHSAKLIAEKLSKGNASNLKIVERDLTDAEKKDRIKLIEEGKKLDSKIEANRERKNEITIGDVRDLESFISYKSLDETPKIVIIDSIDEMNNNAANGLLKVLEEPPPQTIIILISHQIQKILPTIKSRCRVIKFFPISDEAMRNHLNENFSSIKEIELIIKLSEGSIGKAYNLIANDGGVLYSDIIDGFVMGNVSSLINKENIDLAFELVFAGIGRLIKHIEGINDTLPLEIVAFDILKLPVDKLYKLLQESIQKYNTSRNLYLDKFSILDNLFFKLKRLA